ncbi:glycine--tRNA ligase subunit beta [Sphingorhabdus pulchriflava]|uniref:Glycine--tRNA ligase beta subunit n=1 Tax=Sphingorhabdus pulchriflava TaxID=2292257 RepID=A0A371BFD3_9SPHN|nr:glycine--tRNA ligase subunit beta [Sphingorhabdus pulchriflava]RDV06208.1 glycine--tRNA ligase subunit beta [Sphingorhabdus pulchriflava]
MSDFLLELRSEEIPARMQDKAREDLARLFTAELDRAGLKAADIITFATPRRLALIAKGLPLETEAVSQETKGPKAGAPPPAMEGFLRKVGLTQDQLIERDGVFFAVVEKPGRKTAEVMAEAIPAIIRAFPWPKSQRWGAASISTESLRWVRPLQGIVALLGDDVVPCEIDGIVSGSATKGHRFHHSGEVTIGNAGDYAMKLRAAHVIVDQEERRAIIRAGAEKAAADVGLSLVPDEGLVNENSGLTEWPVPMLGRFDPAFLEVPEEVIQLTARVNQKYFVCHDKAGKLANAFVCTANIVANDGGAAIVAGNEKVLAARLSDAKFFWEQDLKIPLDEQAKKLSQITFHEKLGTVADKVERVAKLARWLVEEGIVKGASADDAERAARLCKADLVTGMVGEFPELQGVMGGYYARAQGEADAVADAVRDHYKPVGQGDDVPTAPVTVAVSLADKLDTICAFGAMEAWPTGSKDPFALRRAAIGVLATLQTNGVRLPLLKIGEGKAYFAIYAIGHGLSFEKLIDFFADRLKVQQREAGVRHDLIDAVFALGGEDDLVRLLARVKALQGFVGTDEGANLLAGYKRATNILKQGSTRVNVTAPELGDGADTEDQREAGLVRALNEAEPKAAAAVEAEKFEDAMKALATLREPIDSFFDGVLVFHPNIDIATRRLDLLRRFRDAVHSVADFSKIEG